MATENIKSGNGGQPFITINHSSGAVAEVYLLGATLTSFKTSEGVERLFLSKQAVFDGKTAIRGGVPLVFPQFGPGELPNHGFARTSTWEVAAHSEGTATLTLSDSSSSRELWPFAFKLEYNISLSKDACTCTLRVDNCGDVNFRFQALLHTYLAISDISSVKIEGLQHSKYIDKMRDAATFSEDEAVRVIDKETDQIHQGLIAPAVVTVSDGASSTRVSRTKPSAADAVVWNPWVEKAARMRDFGNEEYKTMVCIEPGSVGNWCCLQPGLVYELEQVIS